MEWTDSAIVLGAKHFGEGKLLVEVFSREHGRFGGVVHAGRKTLPIAQSGNVVHAGWKARLADQLGFFQPIELVEPYATKLLDDALALAGLTSAVALIRGAAPERQAYPQLYDAFAILIESLGVKHVFGVATAAVREAEDGADFVRMIERRTGILLRVLSGEDEARLSALGVQAGAPDAVGVVGDLGGASLELVQVTPEGPGRGETFPLGPLSLAQDGPFDYDRVITATNAALAKGSVLKGALKSVTGGKDIDMDVTIDPSIIGGLIVKVGSRMVDTSLRTKLNSIKIAMKEAR